MNKTWKHIALTGMAVLVALTGVNLSGQGTKTQKSSSGTNMPGMSQEMMGQGVMGMSGESSGMMGMCPMMGMMGGMMRNMDQGENIPSVQTILQTRNMLNLSEDQRKQLRELANTVQKELIQLRAQKEQGEVDFQANLTADSGSQKATLETLGQITDAQARIQQRKVESYYRGLNILTRDQRNQLQAGNTGVSNNCPMMGGMMGGTGMSP